MSATDKRTDARGIIWKCLCDCGNVFERPARVLIVYKNNSCEDCAPNSFKGKEKLSGKYFNKIQKLAEKKNYEFNLDVEYLWKLFEEQNGKCALSGVNIILVRNYTSSVVQTASLDRIDSSKGYIKGNVQWLHKIVNRMKSDFTQENFLEMCDKIAKFNEGK